MLNATPRRKICEVVEKDDRREAEIEAIRKKINDASRAVLDIIKKSDDEKIGMLIREVLQGRTTND